MSRKIFFLLCLLSLIQIKAIDLFGQNVSITQSNITIRAALNEIEKQTKFSVGYDEKILSGNKVISLSAINKPLDEVLKLILQNTGCTYSIKDNHILIVAQKPQDVKPDAKPVRPTRLIKGKIIDKESEPLIGVTVTLKDSQTGTITDIDGNYEINVQGDNPILAFSYVGYEVEEVRVGDKNRINVTLNENSKLLQEVVVVGYGTMKKENLSGAVDAVSGKVLEDRPMPNLARGIQGVVPNLNIRMTDGKPTRSATYNVRGATSIGSGSNAGALILIDGVEGDPALLNPNDIENITVLKDAASAAIYGARGTFGVVLITTKSPDSEKTKITYSGSYSINERTVKPNMINDGYTWATAFNEFYYNWKKQNPTSVNNAFSFSPSYLDELKKRHDDPSLSKIDIDQNGKYVYYGSTDWFKELYKSTNSGMEHSLNISGSSNKLNYYVSGRYYEQDGIFRYNSDDYKMYNLRSKGTLQIYSWLKVNNNFDFSSRDYNYPMTSMFEKGVWRNLADQGFPLAMMFNPDGSLTYHSAATVGDLWYGKNREKTRLGSLRNTSEVTATFFDKKLTVNGDFTFANTDSHGTRRLYPMEYSQYENIFESSGSSRYSKWKHSTKYIAMNAYGTYENKFKNHYVKVMGGINHEEKDYDKMYYSRSNLLNPDYDDIELTDGDAETIGLEGGGYKWVTTGIFFRTNYSYKDKYLLEVNGRYDGTSKFPKNQRWGFFPSASIAYRISEEEYFKNLRNVFSNLKLRASYGSLGNGRASDYLFIDQMSTSKASRIINGKLPMTTRNPSVLPDGLTWEKAATLNFGADFSVFSDRLTFTGDIYRRKTTDMIVTGEKLPSVFGASAPKGNYADMETRGWEISLGWRDKINFSKPLHYDIKLTLSDNRSKILKFPNPTGSISEYYAGQEIGEIWGFVTEGLFQSYEEIYNHADLKQILISEANADWHWEPGDPKLKDLNGDGYINKGKGTLDDPGDQKIIGNTTPRYLFGLNLNADWNNFSLSTFFQGVGKRDWWFSREATYFWGMYNRPYGWLPEDIYNNYWKPDRTDAYYPRPNGYLAYAQNSALMSQTRYLQNAAYIRLKSLTISYSLPSSFIKKAGLSQAKVYLTGQNLWTWSPMFKYTKNFDPEVIEDSDVEISTGSGQGNAYPMLKSYTVGLTLTF